MIREKNMRPFALFEAGQLFYKFPHTVNGRPFGQVFQIIWEQEQVSLLSIVGQDCWTPRYRLVDVLQQRNQSFAKMFRLLKVTARLIDIKSRKCQLTQLFGNMFHHPLPA